MTVLVEGSTFQPATAEDAAQFAENLGLTNPVLADTDGVFLPAYGSDITAPFLFFVLDGEGRITWAHRGETASTLDDVAAAVDATLSY